MRDLTGQALGFAMAPFTGIGSVLRRARVFHPRGRTYSARVAPAGTGDTPEFDLGNRLSGEALVRLSAAAWKHTLPRFEILGCAIRFGWDRSAGPRELPGHQDLLLATIRHVVTTPFAMFSTHASSFLDNDYYSISPFQTDGVGRVKFRVVTERAVGEGQDRYDRLTRKLEQGPVDLELQARSRLGDWQPVATVRLLEEVDVDQERLRFSPFHEGLGVHPVGLINASRGATYLASQVGRRLVH